MSSPQTVHRLAIAIYLGLISLLLVSTLWLDPPPARLMSPLLLILIGPLLFPLRGLLHGRRYTIAWSSMLILLYFLHGTAVAATGHVWIGGLEIVLALGYFSLAIRYVRITNPARQVNPPQN